MEFEDSSDDIRPQLDAKIVLVGDGGVGKTSLITRFTQNIFQETYRATIGLDLFSKDIILGDETVASLRLWDIAGDSITAILIDQYLEGADAVLVCYSINDLESYENVVKWRELLDKIEGKTSNALMFLVATKADLAESRIAPIQGSEVEKINWDGKVEISSKLGGGCIEGFFKYVAEKIKEKENKMNVVKFNYFAESIVTSSAPVAVVVPPHDILQVGNIKVNIEKEKELEEETEKSVKSTCPKVQNVAKTHGLFPQEQTEPKTRLEGERKSQILEKKKYDTSRSRCTIM